MYNSEKIGVGIITYNRPQQFNILINSIKDINIIDSIVIIKDKNIDYKQYDPKNFKNKKIKYFNLLTSNCVASCKNKALTMLIEENCDHIFLIEDDVIIKNTNVFKEYINTAKQFNIGHLNFCSRWSNQTQKFEKPIYSIKYLNYTLDFYRNLCGMFEYFTKDTLIKVGLMNDKDYINALEHVEHTYRICLADLYIPKFHLFADIHNSFDYLEDGGKITTIPTNNSNYNINLINAFNAFTQTYGIKINQLQPPNEQEIINFYLKRIKFKNQKI